ncbi:MAG: glycosyltransferase, partial [Sphingomonas sp.]
MGVAGGLNTASPLLSICIPTYNRAGLLRQCLERLYPQIDLIKGVVEIVIVDNASTDETADLIRMEMLNRRYLASAKQEITVSVIENTMAALRAGRGEFVVFLADDDEIKAEGVVAAIEWLQARPEAAAAFCAMEEVNEAGDVFSIGQSVPSEVVIPAGDYHGVIEFLLRTMHHAEIAVIRQSALEKIQGVPRKTFFGYWFLYGLIAGGDVGFLPVISHRHHCRGVGHATPNEQYAVAVDRMDQCRLGLELLMDGALRQSGWETPPREVQAKWQAFITWRMAEYAEIAERICRSSGNDEAGDEFAVRRRVWSVAAAPEKPKERVLVIRYGGFGDALMASTIFPKLKASGAHITVDVSEMGEAVLRHDPNIDAFLITPAKSVPGEQLAAYWNSRCTGFNRIINLTESIEGGLLQISSRVTFFHDDATRRRLYGEQNYGDVIHRIAG